MASNNTEKPERNVKSVLLSSIENEKLFSLLEYRSQSLASTVVQVYTFDTDKKWTKICCGVACFIRDHKQKSHFIRVYDITVGERIYEHELYNNFEYNRRTSFFHDFAGEDSWIGLNFANDDEADKFNEAIQSYLLQKEEKRLQRRHTKGTIQQTQVPPPPVPSIHAPSTGKDKLSKKGSDKKNKGKKRISKSDITGQSNFIHISHVGYGDSRQGHPDDEELREWLEQIGMSDKVQTSSQLDFIRQWVQDHGGRDAVEKDKEREKEKSSKKGKDEKDKAKERISKSDITSETNFIHISHVGYGDSRQTHLNDEELRELLEQLGISDAVQTSEQLDFLRKWVQDHGGRDAVEKDKERVRRASTKRGPPPPVLFSQPRDNPGPPPILPAPPTAQLQPSAPPLPEMEVPPPSPPPPPPATGGPAPPPSPPPHTTTGQSDHLPPSPSAFFRNTVSDEAALCVQVKILISPEKLTHVPY